MMDFTVKKYEELLTALKEAGYEFITYSDYCDGGALPSKFVILRHDVDKRPENSLRIARLENKFGARATYYFRAVSCSWNEEIIKEIAGLGHEIGYHYESLTTCSGDKALAFEEFKSNLLKLRALAPVKTICMHGSPRSKFDSRDLWKEFSYKELGIIGEPYLDTDFSKVFYLTDTGRRWDGFKVSLRDKIEGWSERWINAGLVFHTTDDVMQAVKGGKFPSCVMITSHPQRWNPAGWSWLSELIGQNLKNTVKRAVAFIRRDS